MLLTKIHVKKLFGNFDHTINFMVHDNITIIHGQNGLGKTAILKLIKAFYDQNFEEIKDVIFDTFSLFYENKTEIRIKRTVKDELPEIAIEKYHGKKKTENIFIPKTSDIRRSKKYYFENLYQRSLFHEASINFDEINFIVNKYVPEHLSPLEPGIWFNHRLGRMMDWGELVERYSRYFPKGFFISISTPDWLRDSDSKTKVSIIETQRLLNKIKTEDGKYRATVVDFSNETIERIKTKRVEASDLASKLDRTYPNRLIQKLRNQKTISSQELETNLAEIEDRRRFLNFVGITDTDENYIRPETIDDSTIKNVLELYVEDSNTKLSVYENLAQKISLFIELINKRFLYKKLSIDKESGFRFTSTIKKDTNVPLTGLSSGEQHELVLFYHILFNTEPGSILLIDEPEISLHISWQKCFVDDLKEVIKLNNIDIVIATHSPDIIGRYWNLTVELKGITDEAIH